MDRVCSGCPKRSGSRGNRGARRVHVVDEQHGSWDRAARREGADHVPAALVEPKPGLPRRCPRPRQQVRHRQVPADPKRLRQRLGGVVSTSEQPLPVRRHGRDDIGDRRREPRKDEVGSETGATAEPALLPAVHERTRRSGIDHCCARGCEREPSADALGAPFHRPGGRRSAACTAMRGQRPQRPAAPRAEQVGRCAAGNAAPRKDEVDEPRRPNYGGRCAVSVPTL